MKSKPTSLREIHINKSDDEKKAYFSYLNDEHWSSDDNGELKEKIKEKYFKEPEIKADILSTDSKIHDSEQTEKEDYRKDKINGNNEIKKWLSRIKRYWVRNYPELIVKELLIKAVGVVIFGLITFFLGFWLQGSVSDKEIKNLKKEFNQKISNLKKDNATTTKQIFDDLYNEKIKEINFNIDNKIDNRLNILDAIQNIDNVKPKN